MLGGPLLLMASGGSSGVTARSVVFDIADNWGTTLRIGIRSVEFKLNGILIPMPETDFSAYASSTFTDNYKPIYAFDTTLSKTGDSYQTEWRTDTEEYENQRLIIVFNIPQLFDEIVINNYHRSGTFTQLGAKTVKITTTPDVYSTTTYNAAVTNGTVLNTSVWPEHVAADTADDQTVWAA